MKTNNNQQKVVEVAEFSRLPAMCGFAAKLFYAYKTRLLDYLRVKNNHITST
jgi:hypothetical protein